ncbi:hypothetical protein SedNR2807_14410 [Citrobacter sedlakii]
MLNWHGLTALTKRTINHINDKFIHTAKQTYGDQKTRQPCVKQALSHQKLYYKTGRIAEIKKTPASQRGFGMWWS